MSLDSLNSISNNSTTDVYTDLNGLQGLKMSARKDSQAALPEVARQFEAVMISMMIKNLRKTGMEDPIFKSQAMDSYRDMYDQQLGMELSKGDGIGLAKTIVEQMRYQAGFNSQQKTPQHTMHNGLREPSSDLTMPDRRFFTQHYVANDVASVAESDTQAGDVDKLPVEAEKVSEKKTPEASDFTSPEHFVEKLWPLAEKAAKKLGVSAEVILSQSALETGWGKHIISDGEKSSFNLFNIKADRSWQGERMTKSSMEFVQDKSLQGNEQQGRTLQKSSDFRAYGSFAQSFEDYVQFLQKNPRYQSALEKTEKAEQSLHDKVYIKAIHHAGYATDPEYSDKVLKVMSKVRKISA